MDSRFKVEVLAATSNPQTLVWQAAHQCVSDKAVAYESSPDTESLAGQSIVKHLLAGDRGHWSPFEAPQISFNVIGFPHSVMQQMRTHRVGWHYSVQSFRYTGNRIYELGRFWASQSSLSQRACDLAEDVFYFRPLGGYRDRQGKRYEYEEYQRKEDLNIALDAAEHYYERINLGFSEEHARSNIPFDVRQNWVMSANVRSLCHVLDLRWKADAQLECQQLCDRIWPHFQAWVPAIAQWYEQNRAKKARLAP